jgi:hypothetical protein
VLFTGLFVAMWIAYGLGQMDAGGVAFISVVAVFAAPCWPDRLCCGRVIARDWGC